MLHLAGGISFGVDIGHFLELQRPFHGDGIAGAAPQVQNVAGFDHGLGDLLKAVVMIEDFRGPAGNLGQGNGQAGLGLGVDRATAPRHGDGQAGQNRQLRGEGLGRGNADFRPGIGVQHHVGFTGDGAFRDVDDRHDRQTRLPRIAQGGQGIDRFSRLGNEQRRTLAAQRGFPVAEFRGDIDLDRNPRQGFEPILGRQAGVIRGAAGDQGQAVQFRRIERQVRYGHRARRRIDEALQGVADDLGLFVDFLQHEVPVTALADGGARQFGQADGPFDRLVVGVEHFGVGRVQHHPVAVFQIHDAVGQGGQGEGVGAQEHFTVTEADRQRAAAPGADHHLMMAGEYDRQGERALEPVQGRGGRFGGGFPAQQFLGDQVDDYFGIRVGRQVAALGDQLGPQLFVIFDDPVVDDRHPVGGMGMGVGFVGNAMGRPSGMADADGAADRLFGHAFGQVGKLALGPAAVDGPIDQGRDPGRIVAPVFQALQPFQQDRRGFFLADNSDDAAHRRLVLIVFLGLLFACPPGIEAVGPALDFFLVRPGHGQ